MAFRVAGQVGDTTIAEALLETILGPEEEVAMRPTARPSWAELEEKVAVQHLYQAWRVMACRLPDSA